MTENVYGSMAESRTKGEEGGALSCVGGLFRLGFGKLLREHVETPNPFHPLLPGDGCAPSAVDGACGQDAASLSLFFLPSSFLCSGLLTCLACAPLPRILTPVFFLFTSRSAVHAQRVCGFFFSSSSLNMSVRLLWG